MIECYRTETPSPFNPLGVKGAGEAGTIAATPAIVNAVEDALSSYGVTITQIPLTPERVKSLMGGPK
jgi:carbon-monoxide dehydrogenase large subunit